MHRLFGHEHAVRGGPERLERLRGVPVGEERVRHRRGLADRRRVDTVEILEVVADVREPVLHRLDGSHAGQPRNGVGDPRRQSARCRRAHRHVGTVGQLGVDTRLRRVGRIEDRNRESERSRQSHQHQPSRQTSPLT